MPDTRSVFAKLFSTLQLSEPAFKSVVVLFRNKARSFLNPKSPALNPNGPARHLRGCCVQRRRPLCCRAILQRDPA